MTHPRSVLQPRHQTVPAGGRGCPQPCRPPRLLLPTEHSLWLRAAATASLGLLPLPIKLGNSQNIKSANGGEPGDGSTMGTEHCAAPQPTTPHSPSGTFGALPCRFHRSQAVWHMVRGASGVAEPGGVTSPWCWDSPSPAPDGHLLPPGSCFQVQSRAGRHSLG